MSLTFDTDYDWIAFPPGFKAAARKAYGSTAGKKVTLILSRNVVRNESAIANMPVLVDDEGAGDIGVPGWEEILSEELGETKTDGKVVCGCPACGHHTDHTISEGKKTCSNCRHTEAS